MEGRIAAKAADRAGWVWPLAVALIATPLVGLICTTLWTSPIPIFDSVGHFEYATRPWSTFLVPTASYYRPLFYLTLRGIWNGAASVDTVLMWVRLLHILPIVLMVALLVIAARVRTAADAGAALFGIAVLIGSPGFHDNLELPLSYTIVGMPAVLLAWVLVERPVRRWHGAALLALTIVAVGFKEQGLVIVPLLLVAWWSGAPGIRPWTAIAASVFGAAYVALRLAFHDPALPMFEQDLGLGFELVPARSAFERFGDFPYGIFLYNAASTVANVLCAEPSGGLFRITGAFVAGESEPWQIVHLGSSLATTVLIGWWGISSVQQVQKAQPEPHVFLDRRLFLAFIVLLLATGVLSFDYSRDRLGGMAVPLYALAAMRAVRALIAVAADAGWRRSAWRAGAARTTLGTAAAVVLLLASAGWQLRALYTLEEVRDRVSRTEREWAVRYGERRADSTQRPQYRQVLDAMFPQGTDPSAIKPAGFPRGLRRWLGPL